MDLGLPTPACKLLTRLLAEWMAVWAMLPTKPGSKLSTVSAAGLLQSADGPDYSLVLPAEAVIPAALVLYGRAAGSAATATEAAAAAADAATAQLQRWMPSNAPAGTLWANAHARAKSADALNILPRTAAYLDTVPVLDVKLVLGKAAGTRVVVSGEEVEAALGRGGAAADAPPVAAFFQIPEQVEVGGDPVDFSRAAVVPGPASAPYAFAIYHPDVPAPLANLLVNAVVEGAVKAAAPVARPTGSRFHRLLMTAWKALPQATQSDVSAALTTALDLAFPAPAPPSRDRITAATAAAAVVVQDAGSSLTANIAAPPPPARGGELPTVTMGRLVTGGGEVLALWLAPEGWARIGPKAMTTLHQLYCRIQLRQVNGSEDGRMCVCEGTTRRLDLIPVVEEEEGGDADGPLVCRVVEAAEPQAPPGSSMLTSIHPRWGFLVRKEVLLYGAMIPELGGVLAAMLRVHQLITGESWAAHLAADLQSGSMGRAATWKPVYCVVVKWEPSAHDLVSQLDDLLSEGPGVVSTLDGQFLCVEVLPAGPDKHCTVVSELAPGRGMSLEPHRLSQARPVPVSSLAGTSATPYRGLVLDVADLALVTNLGNRASLAALHSLATEVDPDRVTEAVPETFARQAYQDRQEVMEQLRRGGMSRAGR